MSLLDIILAVFAVLALGFGGACWQNAHRWKTDCEKCRILIAVKGRVKLDAPLVEVLAWNRALPKRERDRGGLIFQHNGVAFALARPKIGAPSAKIETRTIKPAKEAAGG